VRGTEGDIRTFSRHYACFVFSQFAVRDALSLFDFGGQDSSNSLFIDPVPGRLGEAAAELLSANGLPGDQ